MANLIGHYRPTTDWKSLTLMLIFTYLLYIPHFNKAQKMPNNVFCAPQTDVIVPVDPSGNYQYFPYLIKLTRCRGSTGSIKPSIKKCVPKKEDNVTFTVRDMSAKREILIVMKNHITCQGACVKGPNDCNKFQKWDESNCDCKCQYNLPTTSPCAQPHIWNQDRCDCICPKGTQTCQDDMRVWSGEVCKCVCSQRYANRCARKQKVLNENDCKCYDPPAIVTAAGERVGNCFGSVKQRTIILIAVFEFMALVIMFALFYRFCLQNDDSKFYVLTRKFSFPANKSNKENQNKTESIHHNNGQILEQRSEKATCYDSTAEIITVDGSN